MEIDKLNTTAYQPSTIGVVERFHRTLNTMLGKVVSSSQRDWDDRLPGVLAAYRSSPHESTGFTPNRLFLGREVRTPLDLVMGLPVSQQEQVSLDEFVCQTQEQMSDAHELAREHLRVAAERRKKRMTFGFANPTCALAIGSGIGTFANFPVKLLNGRGATLVLYWSFVKSSRATLCCSVRRSLNLSWSMSIN